MLPLIIISLMLLVLDREKTLENKTVYSDNKEISYPFFGIEEIDNYIANYLNDYITTNEEVLIDYDCIKENNLYYLTFYNYLFSGNKIKSSTSSVIISTKDNSITKSVPVSYEYDIIQNKVVDKEEKMIALTFDDGPNYNTNKVLDILEKYNVPATFFILGSKIKGNEYILKRMASSGMEIGNHTYSHLLLTKYQEDKIKEEIESTSNLIFEVTGKYPTLLRPSYGSVNSKIKKTADMPIIIWDIDTLDWKYHNSKRISKRVLNKDSLYFSIIKEGNKMEKFKAKTERILEKGGRFYESHPYLSTYLIMVASSITVELFIARCMYKFGCFDKGGE